MALSLVHLWLAFCTGNVLVMGVQESEVLTRIGSGQASLLSCEPRSLQYTVPRRGNSSSSPSPVFVDAQKKHICASATLSGEPNCFSSWDITLDQKSFQVSGAYDVLIPTSAQDKAGLPHQLHNDSECGTWVSLQPDGSVVIGMDYTGCYVTEQNEEYTVTIHVDSSLKETLKCPVPPVNDAPSPDVCSVVSPVNKLSCGTIPITQPICEEHGCCYNSQDFSTPCYFGGPVTAHCTADGQATIAVSADVTVPPLLFSSMRLLSVSSGCPGLAVRQNGAFQVYDFPLSCGRSYQQGDLTIYENQLEATQSILTWSGSSITRDSIFRLTVRCSFTSSSGLVPVQVEVFTLAPPLPVSSPGPLLLEMRIAKDLAYGSYYAASEYPVLKVLRDPVYVEVRVLQRTDPNLVLVLNQCWATPTSNPVQQLQWPILVDGCPFAGDNYRTQLIPSGAASSVLQFPSHYQRFIVSTFTFVANSGQNLIGQVYFHCSASVCVPSALGSCTRNCPSSRRKRTVQLASMEPLNLVTAEVPIYFFEGKGDDGVNLQDSRTVQPLSAMLPEWTIGALVSVAFLAVAMVCVGMWSYYRGSGAKAVPVNI